MRRRAGRQASRAKQGGDRQTGIALHLLREFSWHFGRAFDLANTDKGIELPRTKIHITHTQISLNSHRVVLPFETDSKRQG